MYTRIIKILVLLITIMLMGCKSNITMSFPSTFKKSKITSPTTTPVLDVIGSQAFDEGGSLITIDAGINGQDKDSQGFAITYSCYFDKVVDDVVIDNEPCSSLAGLNFSQSSGVFTWNSNFSQSGSYEFKMTATNGKFSDSKIFRIDVNNILAKPILDAIADQVINENSPMVTVNAGDGGDDEDFDGEVISYNCYFDNSIDNIVATTSACSGLTGVSFNSVTGVMNWTPTFSQSGNYEFSIVGTDGTTSDDEIFSVIVNNTNRAPVLDAIADQSATEGIAITTVNAGDGGDDLDIDGQSITYSCYYDQSINGSVSTSGNACSGLSGATFNTSSGALNWLPDMTQSGSYEFLITGSDGSLSDTELFSIVVANINQAPLLDAIADQTVSENIAIMTINAGVGGVDLDADGDTISYECYFDSTIDGAVSTASICSTLSGVSFNGTTGVMNWLPDTTQAGSYEFIIVGSDGSLDDDEIFSITVNNTNIAPVLDAIGDQTVSEATAITTINADDDGDDTDSDSQTISYTCFYDTTVNGAVASTNACTTITGLSFSTVTGELDWTPSYAQSGAYEFKIIGSDGSASGQQIFTITVTNVNRAPALDSISSTTMLGGTILEIDAGDGSDDQDIDSEAITYTCYYDTTINAAVASTNACTDVAGLTFNTTTGEMKWASGFNQGGAYEYKIIGTDGSLTSSRIFSVTVTSSTAFVSKWKTTSPNESITLPIVNGYNYNFNVDWGDGTPIQPVTAYNDAFRSHTYVTAGTYTVSIMGTMEAFSFNSVPTSRLKILEVSEFGDMGFKNLQGAFQGCSNLTTFSGGHTSAVTNMSGMFANTTNLTSLSLASSFDTANVTTMASMFSGTGAILNLDLTHFDTAKVTNMSYMFWNSKIHAITFASGFKTNLVTTMIFMFSQMPNLVTIDLSGFNTANVTDMQSMFSGARLSSLNLTSFDTSKVTDMAGMFGGMTELTSLTFSANFKTNLVKNMNGMFSSLSKLTNINLTTFNTSNVENMSYMFANSLSLTTISFPATFITSKVTDMSSMFEYAGATTLDLSGFDTSKVTNMMQMFCAAEVTNLNISSFDTSQVTNMSSMFNLSKLTSLNLSHFQTWSLTDMSFMFVSASNLVTLNLSNFNTSGVTDMTGIFENTYSLKNLDISQFDTANVTSMDRMFNNSGVENLDLSHFRTSNVTNMNQMFDNVQLASLNVNYWDISRVTSATNIFNNSSSYMDVYCDQGGSPGVGDFFGNPCH